MFPNREAPAPTEATAHKGPFVNDNGDDWVARDIPDAMRREVRQRAGFGCIICGNPILDLHHEPPFHELKQHSANSIFALCPTHHREAGTNPPLLPPSEIIAADADPFCKRHGTNDPYRPRFRGESFLFEVGPSCFVCKRLNVELVLIGLVDLPVFRVRFEDDKPLVYLYVLDETDNLMLWIEENELRFRSSNYDVEWIGNSLILRTGLRLPIALRLEFIPPNKVKVRQGVFWRRGCRLLVTEQSITGPTGGGVTGPISFESAVPMDDAVRRPILYFS